MEAAREQQKRVSTHTEVTLSWTPAEGGVVWSDTWDAKERGGGVRFTLVLTVGGARGTGGGRAFAGYSWYQGMTKTIDTINLNLGVFVPSGSTERCSNEAEVT